MEIVFAKELRKLRMEGHGEHRAEKGGNGGRAVDVGKYVGIASDSRLG